jgi:PAS domain S-box-containing protein
MGISLRSLLLIPFVVELVGITSLVGYLSYRSCQQAVEDLAQQLTIETGHRVTQNLNDYFGIADNIVVENQTVLELGILDWQNPSEIEQYFVSELRTHSPVSAFTIATATEDVLTIIRDHSEQLIVEGRYPSQGTRTRYRLNSEGDLSGKNEVATSRVMLWDAAIQEAETGTWLPMVAPDNTMGHPAFLLTRVEPFADPAGNVQGVLSATFSLDQVGEFLKQLNISPHGQVFILDGQGLLIASSTAESLLKDSLPMPDNQLLRVEEWRLAAVDSRNPVTQAAAAWSLAQTTPTATAAAILPASINIAQEAYFVYEVPFVVTDQVAWKVVVAIPEADFTAAIQANLRHTALLCGVGLCGALGIGLWLMRRLTRPLKQLDRATRQYATEGTFQLFPKTGMKEVDALWQSFEAMTTALGFQKQQMAAFHADYARELEAEVNAKTQALQATTAKLVDAQRLAQVGSWELDVATGEILWSEELRTMLGQDATSLTQDPFDILCIAHPDDRATLQQAIEAGIRDGKVTTIEHRTVRPDGSIRYLLSRGEAIRNDQGDTIKLIGTAADITEQKLTEMALQASEARLRQALEVAGAIAWEHDLQTHEISFTSTGALAMPQCLPYEQAMTQVHPDDQARVRQANEQAMAQKIDSFDIEHRILAPEHPSGWRWFQVHARVVTDRHHQPTRIIGMSVDVTERKQVESALRQANQDMEAILATFPDMLFHIAADGTLRNYKVREEQHLYCPPTEFLGRKVQDVFPAEVGELMHRGIQQALNSGKVESIEYALPMPAEQTTYFEARLVALDDEHVIAVTRDITNRKSLELALQNSEAELTYVLDSAQATIAKLRLFQDESVVFDYISKHCQITYGYSAETLMANPQLWQDHVFPEDWENVVLSTLRDIQTVQDKTSWIRTYRYRHPDGPIRWILSHISSHWMASENYWELTVVESDITATKRAEMAVRASEAKFSTIFHDNPAPAWISKLEDGQCIDVNQSFCTLLGYAVSEMVGRSCTDLHLWADETHRHRLQQTLQQKGGVNNFETVWLTKAQAPRTVLLSARLVTFDGEARVLGVVNDITDRKQTEIKLQQLSQELLNWRDRYELAIWAGRQIIYEYDAENDQYTWGRNTQEFLGYSLEEMPQKLEEGAGFIHPDDQHLFAELMAIRKRSSDPFSLVFRVRRQDGTYAWVEDQGVPQLNDQGKLVKIIGSIKDIDELKRAEAELNQAMELLQQSEANYLAILQLSNRNDCPL